MFKGKEENKELSLEEIDQIKKESGYGHFTYDQNGKVIGVAFCPPEAPSPLWIAIKNHFQSGGVIQHLDPKPKGPKSAEMWEKYIEGKGDLRTDSQDTYSCDSSKESITTYQAPFLFPISL